MGVAWSGIDQNLGLQLGSCQLAAVGDLMQLSLLIK
jgi:hypothetical protein